MSAKNSKGFVTIWLPIDPERERAALIESFHRLPTMGAYLAERCEEHLREQGYRINADDLAQLVSLCEKFESDYLEAASAMRIEACGGGNVLPANVTPIRR